MITPAQDSPELRVAATDSWQARVANYKAHMGEYLREFIQDSGIHLIDYQDLRELK